MRAVVLVSGGLDSTVCLARAVDLYGKDEVTAMTMFYGQKHSKELECAKAIAEHYGVNLLVRDLASVFEFSDCSLLKGNKDIAKGSYDEQQKKEGTKASGAVDSYVPFRNGLFLSYAAAVAYSLGADMIYYGAHADDAAGNAYPDCSEDFKYAMDKAIEIGTGRKVNMIAPFIDETKSSIVAEGLRLNVPFEKTWSCYEGHEKACGKCGTCIDRLRAFHNNDVIDPIQYEDLADEFEIYKKDYSLLPYTMEDGKIVSFDKEFLVDVLDLPGNAVKDNVIDNSRWSIFHSIIFEYKDKFYQATYSVGATEMQDERPWQDQDTVSVIEVEARKVEVTKWVPIKED